MKEIIGLATVILGLIAYMPYIRDIYARRVTPHPYSWFIWGITATLMFGLQILHGGGAMSWSTLLVGIISFFICGISWKRGGKRIITKQDRTVLIMAFIAIILWLVADEPTLSMLLLVTADIIGFIPSIRKTWKDPYSETLTMWSINALRHGLNILAISTYSLLTLADPVVWAICNLGFCIMVLARREIMKKSKP